MEPEEFKIEMKKKEQRKLFEQMADYLLDYSILRNRDQYHTTIRVATELRIWLDTKSTNKYDVTLTNAVNMLMSYSNWLRPSKEEWRVYGIRAKPPIIQNWITFNKAYQQFQLEVIEITNAGKVTVEEE